MMHLSPTLPRMSKESMHKLKQLRIDYRDAKAALKKVTLELEAISPAADLTRLQAAFEQTEEKMQVLRASIEALETDLKPLFPL